MRAPLALLILVTFFITSVVGPLPANADEFVLPKPGVMISLSPPMDPPMLKGIKVHTDNPFRFEFVLDRGDLSAAPRDDSALRNQSSKLIKYFLASLTIPEKDLWVNLSPYEKDRIVPESFGVTEMGRDVLAEDYMLKQITASLIYPEGETGKKFWKRIYEEAQKKYGNTNIPVNTFNKVWIVPEKAVVYENAKAGTAYVVESRLKVMLEADYLSLSKHENVGAQFIAPTTKGLMNQTPTDVNQIGSQIVREIVIPELTREVNEGKNFAQLRQVYNSLILATWYKKKIKDSILSKVYADKSKTQGVNIDDPQEKEKIYQQYLKAFKKGVYNYIKEEPDPVTKETTAKKYFSGGLSMAMSTPKFGFKEAAFQTETTGVPDGVMIQADRAMLVSAAVNTAKVTVKAVKNLFRKRTIQKEIENTIEEISRLEANYREVFIVLESASGPRGIFEHLKELEDAYQNLMREINSYLRQGVLSESGSAARAFQRYHDEVQSIHEESMNILSAYMINNWPRGERIDTKIAERAKDISKVPSLQELKVVLSNRSDELTPWGKSKGRFERVLFGQALEDELTIDPKAIEKFLKEGYRSWDDDNLDEVDKVYPLPTGASLSSNIQNVRVTKEQQIQVRNIIATRLGDELKVARDKMDKRTITVGASLLTTFVSVVSVAWIGLAGYLQTHFPKNEGAGSQTGRVENKADQKTATPKESSKELTSKQLEDMMKLATISLESPKTETTPAAPTEEEIKEKAELEKKLNSLNEEVDKLKQDENTKKKEIERIAIDEEKVKDEILKDVKELQKDIDLKEVIEPLTEPKELPKEWQSQEEPNKTPDNNVTNEKDVMPPDVDIDNLVPAEESLGHGFNPKSSKKFVAITNVHSSFLAQAVYTRLDPITGKWLIGTPNLKPWILSNKKTDETVVVPAHGKELQGLVPSNYKITHVETEKPTKVRVFYDRENHSWWITFDKDPGGFIKEYVEPAKAGELGVFKPAGFVHSSGKPYTQKETDDRLSQDLPAPLWKFMIDHRQGSSQQVRDGLRNTEWFMYTINPLLAQRSTSGNSYIKSMYQNFAEQCNGFACKDVVDGIAMNASDHSYQVGYRAKDVVSMADAHAWVVDQNGKPIDAVSKAGQVSLTPDRVYTSADYLKDKQLVEQRAPLVRGQQMPADLERIDKGLAVERLEKEQEIKRQELARVQKQMQEAKAPSVSSGVGNYFQIQKQVQEAKDKNLSILEALKNAPKGDLNQWGNWVENLIAKVNYQNKIEFIVNDSFITRLLVLLEKKGVDTKSYWSNYFVRRNQFLSRNRIKSDSLVETTSSQNPYDRKYLGSFYERKDSNGNIVLVDPDTDSLINIPQGYKVEQYHAGFILLKNTLNNGQFILMKPIGNGRYSQEAYTGSDLKIFQMPSSLDHWLGYLDEGTEGRFIGPMAEEYNLPTTGGVINNPQAYSFQGDTLIMFSNKQSGLLKVVGPLARKLGMSSGSVYGGMTETTIMENQILVPIRNPDGTWVLYGDGAPIELNKFRNIYAYSDGQWVADVDKEIKRIVEKDVKMGLEKVQVITATGVLVHTNNATQFWPNASAFETESGRLVVLDASGQPIHGDIQGYKNMLQRYLVAGPYVFDGYKRNSDRSEWIATLHSENTQSFIVASPKIMEALGGLVKGGKVEFDWTRGYQYEVFDDGEFFVSFWDLNGKFHCVGSWMVDRLLAYVHDEEIKDGINVVFAFKDGRLDPNRFIVTSKVGTKVFGPIARELGLEGKEYKIIRAIRHLDGLIDISITLLNGVTLMPIYYGGPGANHEEHRANLMAETGEHGGWVLGITPRRLDLWLKYFDASPESIQPQILARYLRDYALDKDNNIPDNLFLNKQEARKVLLKHKSVIAKGIVGSLIDPKKLCDVLVKCDLKDVAAEIAIAILGDPNNSNDLGLVSRLVDSVHNITWEDVFDAYRVRLREQLGIRPSLAEAFYSPFAYTDVDLRNKLNGLIYQYAPDLGRLREYEDKLTQAANAWGYLNVKSNRDSSDYDYDSSDVKLRKFLTPFHEALPLVRLPFDMETREMPSRIASPLHSLARVATNFPSRLKYGFYGDSDYEKLQEQYQRWHKINNELNALQLNKVAPSDAFKARDFVRTLADDPFVLLSAVGILYLIMTRFVRKGSWRQHDKTLFGTSAEEAFEKSWQRSNIDGDGFGSVRGAKELTRQILFEGFTKDDLDELKQLRAALRDEKEKAFIDFVLALPAESPDETQVSSLKRWTAAAGRVVLCLLPGGFAADGLMPPQAFRQKQAIQKDMLKALDKFVKDGDLNVFLESMAKIKMKYGKEVTSKSKIEQKPLSFDDLSLKVQALIKERRPVREEGSSRLSSEHNGIGSKLRSAGRGVENRPYAPGDERRDSDEKAYARTLRSFTKLREQTKTLKTAMVINLSDLVHGQEEAIGSFVDAVQVQYGDMRLNSNIDSDYHFTQVIVVGSDGPSEPIDIKMGRYTPQALADLILAKIKERYEALLRDAKVENYAPKYQTEEQRQKYLDRQLRRAAAFIPQEVWNPFGSLDLQRVYFVGSNPKEEQENSQQKGLFDQVRKAFRKATIFSWQDKETFGLWSPSKAMAVSNTGGIDLSSENFLETQNAGEGIEFHMDPAMLAQLQNAPGFEPLIISIQPMTDVKAFLGISS